MARRRRYARGARAWGTDARSGIRVLLKDLRRDGQTGLPVSRQSFDPKHPQERVVDVSDPQVLRRSSPDLDRPGVVIQFPTVGADLQLNGSLVMVMSLSPNVRPQLSALPNTVYDGGVYVSGVYE